MSESPCFQRREVSVAIVGSGGAGVMTTGELLFTAAASCGLHGVMTKSYGPQIRGGESACFVRLGDRQFEKQSDEIDLMVVLDWGNVDRFKEELYLSPEAWILYENAEGDVWPEFLQAKNNIPVGWKDLSSKIVGGKGRANICALGVLCYLLGIKEMAGLRSIEERFGPIGKAGLDENTRSFHAGQDWARQEWKMRPFQLSIEDGVSNRWALTGNQGIVLGSLVAGCDFYAGYPITPATTIMEDLGHYLPQRGGVMIQAEDELAAINMAIGASFGGKKAMAATSGPGFSLMAEGLGLAVMAEIPLVVVDVQRAGPSTGIATKTEQSDLWAALASSHGDNPRVVLGLSSVQDCVAMTVKAFNIAEMYQVPVILLSDQFLASRTEIVDPIALETFEVRQRQLPAEVEATTYHRFGSSVGTLAPMAVPGMIGGEYTAEGLEHDALGSPNASHTVHQIQSERRLRKLDPLIREEGWIEVCGEPAGGVGFIGWGSTGGVVKEAVQMAWAAGHPVKGIIPHLLFPAQTDLLNRTFEGLEVLYVAELSLMGQFVRYLRSFYTLPPTVIPVSRAGGTPLRTSELLHALEPHG